MGSMLKWLVPVSLAMVLAGCASQRDVQYLQGDMDEVKGRLFKMEKTIGSLKVETKGSVEGALKSYDSDLAGVRKNQADLQAALDTTRVDLQVLAGKVDDARLSAQKPTEELALLRDDMRKRLAAAEDRLQKLQKAVDDMSRQVTEAKAKEVEQTPEALYQKAMDTVKAGDLPKSRELLNRFIELYPRHDLAANAHYWLGETYYSEKNYDQAILEFQEVIKNFSGKDKAPAAMLKQGLAFREIRDVKSARFVLKKLIETYPSSDEAKRAKEKLKELK